MKATKYLLPFLFSAAVVCADTITVTSLEDNGSGSLRDAITNAQSGDTISFDSSLSGTLVLQSSLPAIAVDNLTILGPMDHSIAIDGDSQYQIFNVQANPFTAIHLNLNNGADANQGGAVFIHSAQYAFLKDVTVTPTSGPTGDNALYADVDAVLDVTDVTFTSSDASQVYLNAATMNITSNSELAFIVDGTGGGQINKSGSSTVSLSTPTMVTSDYYLSITDGVLLFSGASSDSALSFSTGHLQGSFDLSDIANLGFVMPGDSSNFGTMNLSGNYISVGGETKIKVDPSQASDLIFAQRDVYLFNSALTLLPASGTYTQGTIFTILNTDAGINGTFSTVTLGGLDAQVNYNTDSIQIEILNDTTL